MTEATTARTHCQATRKDGHPCNGYANAGSVFCFSHDPVTAGNIAEARRRGGRARHGRKVGTTGDTPAVTLTTVSDALDLLRRTADDLLRLENSVSRGRAIIALATAWADVYAGSELERRVAALESLGAAIHETYHRN